MLLEIFEKPYLQVLTVHRALRTIPEVPCVKHLLILLVSLAVLGCAPNAESPKASKTLPQDHPDAIVMTDVKSQAVKMVLIPEGGRWYLYEDVDFSRPQMNYVWFGDELRSFYSDSITNKGPEATPLRDDVTDVMIQDHNQFMKRRSTDGWVLKIHLDDRARVVGDGAGHALYQDDEIIGRARADKNGVILEDPSGKTIYRIKNLKDSEVAAWLLCDLFARRRKVLTFLYLLKVNKAVSGY